MDEMVGSLKEALHTMIEKSELPARPKPWPKHWTLIIPC